MENNREFAGESPKREKRVFIFFLVLWMPKMPRATGCESKEGIERHDSSSSVTSHPNPKSSLSCQGYEISMKTENKRLDWLRGKSFDSYTCVQTFEVAAFRPEAKHCDTLSHVRDYYILRRHGTLLEKDVCGRSCWLLIGAVPPCRQSLIYCVL